MARARDDGGTDADVETSADASRASGRAERGGDAGDSRWRRMFARALGVAFVGLAALYAVGLASPEDEDAVEGTGGTARGVDGADGRGGGWRRRRRTRGWRTCRRRDDARRRAVRARRGERGGGRAVDARR